MNNIKSVLEGRTEGVGKIETKGSCGFLSPFYSAFIESMNHFKHAFYQVTDKVGLKGWWTTG